MFHIRFTYVSFMFHVCFYLRLDIVYVYVMPRPPSIETIPGAPLDQANSSPKMAPHPRLLRAYSLLLDPPEPQNIGKIQCFDLFTPLHLFFLPLSSLTLPTSAFPSVLIVGNLTSKLPSTMTCQYLKQSSVYP